jgi:hypothetical protein
LAAGDGGGRAVESALRGRAKADIQNARQTVGAGDRIEAALKDGSISFPAVAALIVVLQRLGRRARGMNNRHTALVAHRAVKREVLLRVGGSRPTMRPL